MLNLKIQRIRKSVKIENIAKELNVTRQYIYQIERGNYSPDPIQAQKICNVLGSEFGKKKYGNDDQHGLELLNMCPSARRLDIQDYISISRQMGLSCDPDNIFTKF